MSTLGRDRRGNLGPRARDGRVQQLVASLLSNKPPSSWTEPISREAGRIGLGGDAIIAATVLEPDTPIDEGMVYELREPSATGIQQASSSGEFPIDSREAA
jgi:hypothetical protein